MSLLGVVLVVAVVIGFARGGRLANLAGLDLPGWPLLFLAVALQIAAELIPDDRSWSQNTAIAMILGSYLVMSYQKFLADEEICSMLRRMLKSIDVTDERLDLDSIKSVGIGHEYLTHPKTLAHCRTEFYLSDLMSRDDFTTWDSKGRKVLADRLSELFKNRINEYTKPDIAPAIEKDLEKYIQSRIS